MPHETIHRRARGLLVLGCWLSIIGCSPLGFLGSGPGHRPADGDESLESAIDLPASRGGVRLVRRIVQSIPYRHLVVSKAECRANPDRPRLVFIDGKAPSDPTPFDPIALDLMIADADCGLYVSRPCTFGLARTDPACEITAWVLGRYSSEVIDSLRGVLEATEMSSRIVLVGYSGGGRLAASLAQRDPRIQGLVTLAANLDLEAWVALHGHTPTILERSASLSWPLRPGLIQLHVFGARDRNVPASFAEALGSDPDAEVLVLEDVDHTCCWLDAWPRIRARYEGLAKGAPTSDGP